VKDDAAQDLDVEVAHGRGALGSLSNGGEGFWQKVIQGAACMQPTDEFLGSGPQLLVGQFLETRLTICNLVYQWLQSVQFLLVGVTPKSGHQFQHACLLLTRDQPRDVVRQPSDRGRGGDVLSQAMRSP